MDYNQYGAYQYQYPYSSYSTQPSHFNLKVGEGVGLGNTGCLTKHDS